MPKVDVAGLQIDALTKTEFLAELDQRLAAGKKTFVATPYSEFLYAALRDREVLALLNKADIAIPDGVGILWAERFLRLPFTAEHYYTKILQALWQMAYSCAGILLWPQSIYQTFPSKLTGASMVWDIAELAANKGYSIYLLGGFGDTPQIAAQKLQQRYPKLKIVGTSNKYPDDASMISEIKAARPDILLVAYGPIRQERWIADHLHELPAKVMIGLGGTFDYLAGKKLNPPKFIRAIGLEWLYRLITQPKRFKRIMQATFGLVTAVIRYKVFESLPLRNNVVNVVFNREDKVFLGLRKPLVFEQTGYWQFPQGGIDRMEELLVAAKRELNEETSIRSCTVIAVSKHTSSYHWQNGRRKLLFNPLHYRGQIQQIVYWRFNGKDEEIKVDHHELIDYQWAPIDKAAEIIHSERLPLIDIFQQDLRDLNLLEKPA